MSTSTTSSSNYQTVFDKALKAYKRKTNNDLRSHPLLAQLKSCDSPDTVLTLLREQIPGFDQSRNTDDRLTRWLNPTVHVLSAFSGAIGGSIGLVYPPAGVVFTGIGVLLSAASDGQDALARIFERMENFFRRLEIYINVPPTTGMTDVVVKIMVEVLSILAIATKEIKRGRAKKYLRKLVERNDIEDALGRLDRLPQEEALIATAQILKTTHNVDDKVEAVGDKVQGVDDRVRDVDDKLDVVIDGGEKISQKVQQVADDQKRNQLRKDFQMWLSPPDPSVNYNIASDAHHEGTALWFTEGDAFRRWKVSDSLLWIYGKPGSGKSVLSSFIIQDIERDSKAGSAHVAYFFFDFKDQGKKDSRALLTSLIVQLSYQSDSFFDALFRCYSTHQSGTKQPGDRALTQCLEEILRIPEVPIYLIIDALDECPSSIGLPPPREKVLELVEKLVEWNLPNLRLCVTSRPEIDIRMSLEPLTSNRISLHDEIGQRKDITDYVRSVVYSDRNMRRWRDEDKELVIKSLAERADGMFRWVFCQLETLRPCLPPSVRHVLDELPETLDETYQRILQEIPKSNRVYAHRLLQCLTVAVRPLRVEELAEVLAVDFDAIGGIPRLNEDLRWEDQEQAVLSACSSLIAVVDDGWFRVVHFSHFSVKEFLTSDRLATSEIHASRYHHILLKPAHTIMAQACLGILLRLDSRIDDTVFTKFPLTRYAAEHFGDHAEFEDVLSHLQAGIDDLLDADRPHFSTWLWVRELGSSELPVEGAPLYTVAELGFCRMVEYLISKRPQDLTVEGRYGTPLHGALHQGHADLALLLLGHCKDVDARGTEGRSLLHLAVDSGLLEATRILVERHATINVRDSSGQTPLHMTMPDRSRTFDDTYFAVVQFLIEHGADVNAQAGIINSTPLHVASYFGSTKVARLLLENGANINGPNEEGQTPLHRTLTEMQDHFEDHFFDAVRFLLEHGADTETQDNDSSTPLHVASKFGSVKAARQLLEHGANIHARNSEDQTPLHLMSKSRNGPSEDGVSVIRLFLERGADIDALDNELSTPLHVASRHGNVGVARLLLQHGANPRVRDKYNQTPLHLILSTRMTLDDGIDVIRLFLELGADLDAEDIEDSTPLHVASQHSIVAAAQLLIEHGAHINVRNKRGQTPLHLILSRHVSSDPETDVIRFFLAHGADIDALDNEHSTPLHLASQYGSVRATRLLLEHGANIRVRNKEDQVPLQVLLADLFYQPPCDHIDLMRLFLGRGGDVESLMDSRDSTLLHWASYWGSLEVLQLLLQHDAKINVRNKDGQTPLHSACFGLNESFEGAYLDSIRFLLEHGADVNALDNNHWTPLHFTLQLQDGFIKGAQLLLEHGANIHLQNNEGQSSIQVASRRGEEFTRLLSEHLKEE